MKTRAALTPLVLALAACGSQQYKNAAAFEAELKTWAIVGKNEQEVSQLLAGKGFSCSNSSCTRNVSEFPCMQMQAVVLIVNAAGVVNEFQVKRLPNGELPTACT